MSAKERLLNHALICFAIFFIFMLLSVFSSRFHLGFFGNVALLVVGTLFTTIGVFLGGFLPSVRDAGSDLGIGLGRYVQETGVLEDRTASDRLDCRLDGVQRNDDERSGLCRLNCLPSSPSPSLFISSRHLAAEVVLFFPLQE